MSAVVTLLSEGEAQRLTQRIQLTASSVRDGLFKLRNLVDEARDSNVWQVMGFASWTAYLADTLGAEPMRLGRDERQELVGYLAGEGLSTRAIAPIVGVAHKTVARDLAPVSNDTPDSDASPASDPAVAAPVASPTSADAATVPPKIQGLDGKQYTRPEPKLDDFHDIPDTPIVDVDWKPYDPPVAPVDPAAELVTAETESKAIGRALVAMSSMASAAHRERVVSHWWPLGNDAVPPDVRKLFAPRSLRDIATHLMQLADELEASL
ncbi:MAG: hypothetical protein K0S37_2374 [Microbacterium sp.]|jgi:hypothetical protein|nr:hypothetical protein [Microbacterium sp.]